MRHVCFELGLFVSRLHMRQELHSAEWRGVLAACSGLA